MVDWGEGVAAAALPEPEPFEFRRLDLSLALITFSVTAGARVLQFVGAFVSGATAASVSCEKLREFASFGDTAEAGEKWWKVEWRGVNSGSSSVSCTPGPASSMASGLNQLLG